MHIYPKRPKGQKHPRGSGEAARILRESCEDKCLCHGRTRLENWEERNYSISHSLSNFHFCRKHKRNRKEFEESGWAL